jgi:hypothetical protein
MEKFIKMTVSYIDSSRGLRDGRWRQNVHYRRTRDCVRRGGKRDLRADLLGNADAIKKGLTVGQAFFLFEIK